MSGRRVRRTYPDTIGDVRARLFTHVRTHVGWPVSDGELERILRRCSGWSPQGSRALDAHLVERPDTLRAPDPHAPMVAVRLAHAIAEAGHPVTLPTCVRCGKARRELVRVTPQGRCCEWCATRDHLAVCARCGELGHPVAGRAEGTICRRCYRADPGFVTACAGCGRERPPTTRDDEGAAWCWTCTPRPQRRCTGCGQIRVVKANTPAGPVCRRCYVYPERECGGCGQIAVIVLRGHPGGADLCRRCRAEPVHSCAGCGQDRPAKAFWPIGPVCGRCYQQTLISPRTCPACGQLKVLIGPPRGPRRTRRAGVRTVRRLAD